MMKTIIQSLILLAAILLMGACQSKSSKSTQLVVKTDSVVVDTPKFDLTSVVVPSLADEFVKEANYLASRSVNAVSSMASGDDHVFQVCFYQVKDENFVELYYAPWYLEKKEFPLVPRRIKGKKVYPKYSIYPLDGYITYKKILFAFYNLSIQGEASTLVDSTKIKKNKPVGFQTLEDAGTDVTYDGWGKIFKIHSKNSLELVFNGMM